jgi:hypothetical protein
MQLVTGKGYETAQRRKKLSFILNQRDMPFEDTINLSLINYIIKKIGVSVACSGRWEMTQVMGGEDS